MPKHSRPDADIRKSFAKTPRVLTHERDEAIEILNPDGDEDSYRRGRRYRNYKTQHYRP